MHICIHTFTHTHNRDTRRPQAVLSYSGFPLADRSTSNTYFVPDVGYRNLFYIIPAGSWPQQLERGLSVTVFNFSGKKPSRESAS